MKKKLLMMSFALIFSACTTTKLSLVWHDASFQKGPIRKILVIGMTDKDGQRRAFEYQMAKQFQNAGVSATPSAGKINIGANVSKDELVAQIRTMDVDSVIVSRLLGVETETQVTPPTMSYVPETATFGRYYATAQREVYNPGYTTEYKVFKIETNIYSVETEGLIWAGTSSTTDPLSPETMIESIASAVIKDLQKNKLIEKGGK